MLGLDITVVVSVIKLIGIIFTESVCAVNSAGNCHWLAQINGKQNNISNSSFHNAKVEKKLGGENVNLLRKLYWTI